MEISGNFDEVKRYFAVVATGRCHGMQTIDRAELQAVTYLHEQLETSLLLTDSKYAMDSWERVKLADSEECVNFQPNSDLLTRLFRANRAGGHVVQKVKAHTWQNGGTTEEDPFNAIGNEIADQVAKAASKQSAESTISPGVATRKHRTGRCDEFSKTALPDDGQTSQAAGKTERQGQCAIYIGSSRFFGTCGSNNF